MEKAPISKHKVLYSIAGIKAYKAIHTEENFRPTGVMYVG